MTLCLLCAVLAWAEDGHALWLRMKPVKGTQVETALTSPTARLAADELRTYGQAPSYRLVLNPSMADDEGYRIEGTTITARRDIGLLYGAYDLLRRQLTGQQPGAVVEEHPAFALRLLNHWDNLDGSIERGYAGLSILWGNDTLPTEQTLREYGRANASVGINGTVLNNVNASPQMLSAKNLQKVKVMADALRPYGLKVYLSVNFASPIGLGKLETADPLDPQVRQWWQKKVDEIYSLVPDFGGFLVKASSEGQPGPGDFGRTHADGANMLADALGKHGGIVMWRAFVYGYHTGEDRVKKAVMEFEPLDGQFRPNVIIQIKNGPLDFQPREPHNPLFDRLQRTPMMPELQITQEYTGQSRHLVYLAPMWREFFDWISPYLPQSNHISHLSPLRSQLPGIAGVANIGNDRNWCGHHFSQANWYAFGRLAWNPMAGSEQIAREWLCQTFTADERFVAPMAKVMEESREACVNYMMPLGLHHIFKGDHHYGPEPEGNQPNFPDEWKPVWYHKADAQGIGFDRTTKGTNATSQYRAPFNTLYNNIETCPDELLLWFHHVPWTHRMHDGQTLWQSLCHHYQQGVDSVDSFARTWQQMAPYVDQQRHREVSERLAHQQENAREWRDHCLQYFQQFSGMKVE